MQPMEQTMNTCKHGNNGHCALCEHEDAAHDAAMAAQEMPHGVWQPIETAPRDGTEVLVCRVYETGSAEYAVAHNYDDGNGWRDMGDMGWAGMTHDDENQPTHWMPLPAPPQKA